MKRFLMMTAITLVCFGAAFAQNTSGTTEMKEKSLYQRLGGYDAPAAAGSLKKDIAEKK